MKCQTIRHSNTIPLTWPQTKRYELLHWLTGSRNKSNNFTNLLDSAVGA
jgi:hypothetical protein